MYIEVRVLAMPIVNMLYVIYKLYDKVIYKELILKARKLLQIIISGSHKIYI